MEMYKGKELQDGGSSNYTLFSGTCIVYTVVYLVNHLTIRGIKESNYFSL